jgi:broad specificity phosphatase PhoE
MTTIYICRHGQTENNKKGRLSGWIDTPLTQEGLHDVQLTAVKLKGIHFDSIHSSDLGRAFLTAYLIARSVDYKSEIQLQKDLREVNYGDFANKRWTDLSSTNTDLLNDTNFTPPNGETLAQMQQRVLACLDNISKDYSEKIVLLSSHDGPINAIIADFNHIDLGELMKTRTNPHDFVAKILLSNGTIKSFIEM